MKTLAGALVITVVLCCSGCTAWKGRDGTRHTLIIGLGLVANKETPGASVSVLRTHTLGLAMRPGAHCGGLVLGYQNLQETAIGRDWSGVVRVGNTVGGPLTVEGLRSGEGSLSIGGRNVEKKEEQ